MIEDLLKNKTVKQKATIKGQEIAKVDFRGEHTKDDIKVDITSIEAIEGGVQVLAKAWKGNKQLGFGKDGSVEIERFRVFNPPVLVRDPEGDIIREWIDEDTGETEQLILREDVEAAITQSIIHSAKVVGKEDTNIKKGKVGNTTSTFFPAAGSSSPVDGRVQRESVNEGYTTIHNGAGTSASDTDAIISLILFATSTTDQYSALARFICGFDTSSIADTDVLDSATLSLWGFDSSTGLGDTDVDIVSSAPASSSTLANGDYANLGTTRFATGVAISAFNIGSYEDYTLNASGEAQIDFTGNSFFGVRRKWDVDNSFTGTWSSSAFTRIRFQAADTTGTANDPKLVVEHSELVFIPRIIMS